VFKCSLEWIFKASKSGQSIWSNSSESEILRAQETCTFPLDLWGCSCFLCKSGRMLSKGKFNWILSGQSSSDIIKRRERMGGPMNSKKKHTCNFSCPCSPFFIENTDFIVTFHAFIVAKMVKNASTTTKTWKEKQNWWQRNWCWRKLKNVNFC